MNLQNKVLVLKKKRNTPISVDGKIHEGSRNTSATKYLGSQLRKAKDLDDIESLWGNFRKWNQNNCIPPLSDKELSNIFHSILDKETTRRESENYEDESKDKKENQCTRIYNHIKNCDTKIFLNEFGEPYIRFYKNGHYEIHNLKSRSVFAYITNQARSVVDGIMSPTNIETVLKILESDAFTDNEEYKLCNRIGKYSNSIYYDLCNKDWSVVEITKDGWNLEKTPPLLFRRYSHQAEQELPQRGGDIRKVFDYVNVNNTENQDLLYLVWLVSCFIPGISIPIIYIHGSQGSAKSTFSRFTRELIDPSKINLASLPRHTDDLTQNLAHNYFLFFDNVSYISHEVSDLLCRAVTGGGFSKRALYTNADDYIYNIHSKLGINGINNDIKLPDLLERSLVFELQRVSEEKRTEEKKLIEGFLKDKPFILGAIFDTISKAMEIYPTIKLEKTPRMADFATWGCAIVEALGFTQKDFLSAYNAKISKQNDELTDDNILVSTLLDFIKPIYHWRGTMSELLEKLRLILGDGKIRQYSFINQPNQLSKELNRLIIPLQHKGITFERGRDSDKYIILNYTDPQPIDSIDVPTPSMGDTVDEEGLAPLF